jgi:hypothetical protein
MRRRPPLVDRFSRKKGPGRQTRLEVAQPFNDQGAAPPVIESDEPKQGKETRPLGAIPIPLPPAERPTLLTVRATKPTLPPSAFADEAVAHNSSWRSRAKDWMLVKVWWPLTSPVIQALRWLWAHEIALGTAVLLSAAFLGCMFLFHFFDRH